MNVYDFQIVNTRPQFTVIPGYLIAPSDSDPVEFYKKLDGNASLRMTANLAATGQMLVAPGASPAAIECLRKALGRALGLNAAPADNAEPTADVVYDTVPLPSGMVAIREEAASTYMVYAAHGALGPIVEHVSLDDARTFSSNVKGVSFIRDADGTYHLTEKGQQNVNTAKAKLTPHDEDMDA